MPEDAYRAGNRDDFDRLYRASYPRLVRTLYAVLGDAGAAEDCVQDSFVQAFKAWARWRPEAPAEAWLHRIALNLARSYQRRQRIREVGELVRRIGRPADPPDPGEVAEQSQLLATLRRLPSPLSAAIVLRHYHGYTNREIAYALGVSERTIGARIAEGLRRLRSELEAPAGQELPTSASPDVEVLMNSEGSDG
jgi:RNA polymerase sigma factor (sigma-70 family)